MIKMFQQMKRGDHEGVHFGYQGDAYYMHVDIKEKVWLVGQKNLLD